MFEESDNTINMDKVGIGMPDRADSASSDYKLFPSKYKRGGGRAKKSPEKLHVDLPGRRTEYQYKIMSRPTSYQPGSQPCSPSMSLTDQSWPSILSTDQQNNLQAVSQRRQQPRSFAEMVKVKNEAAEKEKAVIAVSMGNKVSDKTKTKTKPVLNKISAFTYNQIGKSDDESKYVSSNRTLENSNARTIPSAVRREVLVEFRESSGSEEDDFEVQFCSSAAEKDRNTVNKISAGTFHQIGNTSLGKLSIRKNICL